MGFGLLIHIYPQSVLADLIRMKREAIHYVCSDGAQANTPSLQYSFEIYKISYNLFGQGGLRPPRPVFLPMPSPTNS